MKITKMTELDAKEICNWKYPDEYSVYNLEDWETIVEKKWALADEEKRNKQFRSVYEDDNLIGYFRFKEEADYITIGLGMNPDICGHGYGKKFMLNILESEELKKKRIKLEVRMFNKRAIRCYESVGFVIIDEIEINTLSGRDKFIVMEKLN